MRRATNIGHDRSLPSPSRPHPPSTIRRRRPRRSASVQTDDGPRLRPRTRPSPSLGEQLAARRASPAAATSCVRLPASLGAAGSIALIGLGTATSTADALRYAAGSAARQLTGVDSRGVRLPARIAAEAAAVLEGAGIGAYAYTEYRRARSRHDRSSPADDIVVHVRGRRRRRPASLERAPSSAAAVHTRASDLVNTPPSRPLPRDARRPRPSSSRRAARRCRGLGRGTNSRRAASAASWASAQGSRAPAAPGQAQLLPRRGDEAPRPRRQGHHLRLRRPLAEARRHPWSA